MNDRSRVIELNDTFRRTFVGGRVLLSREVDRLPPEEKLAVLAKVKSFDGFDETNDLVGKHDLISVEHRGQQYFAKIDYYAPGYSGVSNAPADASKTVRVLTVMQVDEY
jgi:hypothetical protein